MRCFFLWLGRGCGVMRSVVLPIVCVGLIASTAGVGIAQSFTPQWQLPPGGMGQQGDYRGRPGPTRGAEMVASRSVDVPRDPSPREIGDVRPVQHTGPYPAYVNEASPSEVRGEEPYVEGNTCAPCSGGTCVAEPCGEPCGLGGRFWFRADYLMWWTKAAHVLPLASTGPLDVDGTDVLFGGNEVDLGMRSGGRFTMTYWTCPLQDVGIEGSYLFLGSKAASYANSNAGTSSLGRPYVNATNGVESFDVITAPGVASGGIEIQTGNELMAAELLFRRAVIQDCNVRADFLVGYRYARFSEDLAIRTRSVGIPDGTVTAMSDLFSAGNEFNGAEIGFTTERRWFRLSCDAYAKLAVGSTRSRVGVSGQTDLSQPASVTPGGLLTQPSNIGVYEERNFTMMPEVGVNLSYDLTARLKARFGYSLLYWSKIARPSDQVDRTVNTNQPTGLAAPQFRFVTNDFWAQGLNFGLDYSF